MYTIPQRPATYEELCGIAERESGTVKLSRNTSGWGLEVTLRPSDGDPRWRAFATLFPEIGELDAHAWHLARWVAAYRPAPIAGGHETRGRIRPKGGDDG